MQRKSWRMSCDIGEAMKGLENELWQRWSDGRVGEWAPLYICISMSSAHSTNFPSLHLRRSSFSNPSVALPTSQLILQPFRCFTYVTAHSPTFPSLHLRHSSFSNPSVASPTSQIILHPFRRFTYVTAHSPTFPLLHLRHNSFSNPSFASPTSQALHLIHLASRPCSVMKMVPMMTENCRIQNNLHVTNEAYRRKRDIIHFLKNNRNKEKLIITHIVVQFLISDH